MFHSNLKVLSFITKPKLAVAALAIFCLLTAYLLPSLTSKGFAEDKVVGDKVTETTSYNSGIKRVTSPEYLVYTEDRATYVKLKRKYFFFWDVSEIKSQTGKGDELAESINEELITPDDFASELDTSLIDNFDNYPSYEPGSILTQLEGITTTASIVLGENQQDNALYINGKATSIRNISNLSFNPSEKYLYYIKFDTITLSDGFTDINPHGKIYRYEINTKREDVIYDFGKPITLSFKANDDLIFYATSTNEMGTIDLNTKDKKLFDTNSLNTNLTVNIAGDIGVYTPLTVLSINQTTTTLQVTLPQKEPVFFTIDLESFGLL